VEAQRQHDELCDLVRGWQGPAQAVAVVSRDAARVRKDLVADGLDRFAVDLPCLLEHVAQCREFGFRGLVRVGRSLLGSGPREAAEPYLAF